MTILINNMQLKNTSLGYFELKLFSLLVDYITLQDFKLPYKTFCLLPFDFIFQICWTIFPRYGPNEDHMDIFLCLFSVRKSGGHDESLVKSVHVRSENYRCPLHTGNKRKFISSLSKAPLPFSHKKYKYLDDNACKNF